MSSLHAGKTEVLGGQGGPNSGLVRLEKHPHLPQVGTMGLQDVLEPQGTYCWLLSPLKGDHGGRPEVHVPQE